MANTHPHHPRSSLSVRSRWAPSLPRTWPWLLALLLLSPSLTSPLLAQVEVRHLGNEGFLLSAGDDKVLIDALYGDGLAGYPVVPADLRRQIETAEGDFADVDLVLASHFHGDHFDADAVVRHLKANPRARFASTPQAVEALTERGVSEATAAAFWPAAETFESYEYSGVKATALRFHHGRSSAQNLGWVIEIGGMTFLHLGDTVVTPDELATLPIDRFAIDVALVPYWYFDSKGLHPVLDRLEARHLVAMHFPAADAPANYFGTTGDLQGQIAACRKGAPEAWMAHRPGETRRYSPRVTAGSPATPE